jgi:hypothetical protein
MYFSKNVTKYDFFVIIKSRSCKVDVLFEIEYICTSHPKAVLLDFMCDLKWQTVLIPLPGYD